MASSKEDRHRGWRDFPIPWESRSDHIWELLSPRWQRNQRYLDHRSSGSADFKAPTLTLHILSGVSGPTPMPTNGHSMGGGVTFSNRLLYHWHLTIWILIVNTRKHRTAPLLPLVLLSKDTGSPKDP